MRPRAAELAAPADVARGAAQASAKRSGDAFFAVGHFAEAAEAFSRYDLTECYARWRAASAATDARAADIPAGV